MQGDILYYYKGIAIRKSNRHTFLFPEAAYKRLIDAAEETGLSIHKILYYSGRPCDKCPPQITVYDKNGKAKVLKKGILNEPDSNGVNIIEQSKNRNAKINQNCEQNS